MECCSTGSANDKNSQCATGIGILIVRWVTGIIFIYYGGQHCFGFFDVHGVHGVHGINAFSRMIASDHFPILPPIVWAWISGITEFFGGILLIVGLASRIVGALLIIDMLAAIWAYYGGGFGAVDFNVALIAMAALILIAGPGIYSIDAVILTLARRCRHKPTVTPTATT